MSLNSKQGVFITGTDTNVGKTFICAGLLKLLSHHKSVAYWKPVQTGTIVGDDTKEVKRITEFSDEHFVDPVYRFPEPLSPQMASKKWGKIIELPEILKVFNEQVAKGKFLVVEGAGGLMMPLNDKDLQWDLISQLKLPVIVVAEDRVGAINQTLLTLNACKDKNIQVLGMVLTKSRKSLGISESLEHFGKVEILANLENTQDVRNIVAQVGAHKRIRELFDIASLPH